jgi:hypothetical protein
MAENIMFNIGVGIDDTEVRQDLTEVTEQIRQVLETDLGFTIRAGNITEIIQQVENLGGKFDLVRDSVTGLVTGFTASATSMSGQLAQISGNFNNLKTGTDSYVASLSSMRDQISGQTADQKAAN